jgi:signal transduction histidine kinase
MPDHQLRPGAGQHLPERSPVRSLELGQRLEAVDEAATVTMTVSNDGDPISEPNREKIFDAFFTTRRDTGGTGMGLAIAQAVMKSHDGSIRLLPSDKGVAFELQFPTA